MIYTPGAALVSAVVSSQVEQFDGRDLLTGH